MDEYCQQQAQFLKQLQDTQQQQRQQAAQQQQLDLDAVTKDVFQKVQDEQVSFPFEIGSCFKVLLAVAVAVATLPSLQAPFAASSLSQLSSPPSAIAFVLLCG